MVPVSRGRARRQRVLLLGSALPLALLIQTTAPVAALSADPWPMAQYGPARVGYNPAETVIGTGNVGTLTESWSVSAGNDIITLEPVVANGLAYVSDGEGSDTITAYRLTDGSVAWTAVGDNTFAPNAVIGSNLWVTTVAFTGQLEDLNALSGAVVWAVNAPHNGTLGAPAVVGNVIYAYEFGADAHAYVDAFSAVNGASLWQAPVAHETSATLAPATAVSGRRVFVLDEDATNHLVIDAFNASSGALDWTYDTHAKDRGFTLPPATVSIQSHDVILGYGTHVWSIKEVTGHVRWIHTESGADYTQPMEAYGDLFTSNGTHDEALDQNTGHVVWTSSSRGINVTAVADQVVYGWTTGPSNVHLKALSALNGSLLWTSGVISPSFVDAPVVVADGVVLAIGLDSSGNPFLDEFAPS